MPANETAPAEGQQFEQQLKKELGTLGNTMIVLSSCAPAITAYLYVPVLFWIAGTFSFWAAVIGVFLALGMALCYAVVGTAYPAAGGEYYMLGRVFGKGVGFTFFLVMMFFYVLLLATYGLGAGLQVQTVWASVDPKIVGVVFLGIAALLSIPEIKIGSWVNGVMLALQVVVIGIIAFAGFAHPHSPTERLFTLNGLTPEGTPMVFTWSVILVGVTLAFFNFAGFQNAIIFAEETADLQRRARNRKVFRALMASVITLVVLIGSATIAPLLGAPTLEGLFTSQAPINYLLDSYGMGSLATFLNLAVAVAILNALIASVMIFGRVLWSAARDNAFPTPINRVIAHVNPRFRTPYVASIIMAVIGCAAMFSSALTGLVTLTGFMSLVWMTMIAAGAIVVTYRKQAPEHFRMPLGPVIPLALIGGFVVMFTGQSLHDLAFVGGTLLVGLVYYLLYLWPRRASRWLMLDIAAEGCD